MHTIRNTIINYFEVTKPKIWSLLLFTAIGAFIVASEGQIPYDRLFLMIAAVTLGSAGANTLTNYIDRDIDSVMNRTRLRPIPSRRIYPAVKALYFGLILVILSFITSYILNPLTLILMMLGIFDNVIIYSKIFKRKNPINIIVGGFSGGIPALIGYSAVKGFIDTISLIIAALVVLWIPTHIWSLAIRYKEDYIAAKVPMLPVVVSEKVAVRCIGSTSLLMFIFSIIPFLLNIFGTIYLITAIIFGGAMFLLNLWLIAKPTKERAWIVFKFSSPYLALIFTAMILDVLLR
ncbi:MAG: heme o synthase [Nitrososphaerota archaeon]|nr:heme o synthase [Nitrososphaerales archaeon]MDW8045375.1 heme o synthase [Nitrososphaerota archaeon]